MAKHRRRLAGPTFNSPLVWCNWISERLGVWERSTLLHRGFLSNDYEHVVLGDVIRHG